VRIAQVTGRNLYIIIGAAAGAAAVLVLQQYWQAAQLTEVKRRVDILEELTKGQAKPIALLDSFADTVPPDLWITSLEQKESLLKLSGTAFSTTAVSDFMTNLKGSGKFKDVDIVVSRQDIAKSPSLVTFEVTCKFEI